VMTSSLNQIEIPAGSWLSISCRVGAEVVIVNSAKLAANRSPVSLRSKCSLKNQLILQEATEAWSCDHLSSSDEVCLRLIG
jgi:hypothetical protein